MKLTISLLAFTAKLLSGASLRLTEGFAPDPAQRVYFANHTSHLDALVLWASLPREVREVTRPVAAKDYWDQGPVRRYIGKTFNAILIDRTEIKVHQSPIDLMIQEMGEKYSIILFPEGSRNTEEEMGDFKSGLYYLAKKRPDLELVPVYIENLNRVLPRGEFLPVPLLSCITIGLPIYLEKGENSKAFLRRAREAVRSLKEPD
jgi:1-acyl-sn-glycerol-3-phosphate acyltransferase